VLFNKGMDRRRLLGSYWRYLAALALIFLLGAGAYFAWVYYLSPEAKEQKQVEDNYEKYLESEAKYEEAMRNDTYGGKTPEETLQLFIDALRKEDIELASKYFLLREDGSPDPKWIEALRVKKEAGELQEIVDTLSKAKPDLEARSYEGDFKFYVDDVGEPIAYVNMEFNQYSGVWKIESL